MARWGGDGADGCHAAKLVDLPPSLIQLEWVQRTEPPAGPCALRACQG